MCETPRQSTTRPKRRVTNAPVTGWALGRALVQRHQVPDVSTQYALIWPRPTDVLFVCACVAVYRRVKAGLWPTLKSTGHSVVDICEIRTA